MYSIEHYKQKVRKGSGVLSQDRTMIGIVMKVDKRQYNAYRVCWFIQYGQHRYRTHRHQMEYSLAAFANFEIVLLDEIDDLLDRGKFYM